MVGSVKIHGLKEHRQMLRTASKDMQREFKKRQYGIAKPIAEEARFNLLASGLPQTQALADSVKAVKSGPVPTLRIGGAKTVTSTGGKAYQLMYGADWGSNQGLGQKQFPGRKKEGRGPWKAINANQDRIAEGFFDSLDELWDEPRRF